MEQHRLFDIFPLEKLHLHFEFEYKSQNQTKQYKETIKYKEIIKCDIETFFDKLTNEYFEDSTVGKLDTNIINKDIRSSKKFNKFKGLNFNLERNKDYPYILEDDDIDYEYNIYHKIDTDLLKSFDISKYLKFVNFDYLSLIKYEVNDHFDSFHYDTFTDKCIGTILIFPPNTINHFEGGDLIFKDENSEVIIEPSKFTEWTVVVFGKQLHKCTKVTSGVRYVFKGNLYSNIPILNNDNSIKLDIVEDLINSYSVENNKDIKLKKLIDENTELLNTILLKRNELNKLKLDYIIKGECIFINIEEDEDKDSDENLEKSNIRITNPIYKKDYEEYIKLKELLENNYKDIYNLHDKKKYIEHKLENNSIYIYCLQNYYDNPDDINKYNLEDLQLIKSLIKTNNKVIGYNCDISVKKYAKNTYYGDESKYTRSFDKYKWLEFDNYKFGKIDSKRSEFNDEGAYDKITTYISSCLIIYS
jgi:hypothetical protein